MPHPPPQWESVWEIGERFSPPPIYFGDMRTDTGDTLRWQADEIVYKTTLSVANTLGELPQYQALRKVLVSDKLPLFFEKTIKREIYKVIQALCALEWYNRHRSPVAKREVIWHDHQGLGPTLQGIWPSQEVQLTLGSSSNLLSEARSWARRYRGGLARTAARMAPSEPGQSPSNIQMPKDTIVAIHYVDGLDLTRRSDIFWHPKSDVDPSRVLLYFDTASRSRLGAPNEIVTQIEKLGMKWIFIKNEATWHYNYPIWDPKSTNTLLLDQWRLETEGLDHHPPLAKWLTKQVEFLLKEVGYWLSFYGNFNIKVLLEPDESSLANVIQAIALDLHGGIHVGRQRSEDWGLGAIGDHPNHVYFALNRRGGFDAQTKRNRINSVLVSGFPSKVPHNSNTGTSDLRTTVTTKGARFVVALFDNTFWWGGSFSKSMVQNIYRGFLEWVLDDRQVGILNKSKKSLDLIMGQMPDIHELMAKALDTGRWVNLDNPFGRLPSDASRAADMSVGIGISSAAIEAVAHGGKAVHCDLSAIRSHSFYQYGYEKIVFDDLDRLLGALKRYKFDSASESELGNFAGIMDQVDPFHDGCGSERVGTYICWLMETLDLGHSRDEAITRANERYGEIWGADKMISPQDLHSLV